MFTPENPKPADPQRDSPATSTFAWFAARRESGDDLDFETFVAEHPKQADELRALHAGWSQRDSATERPDRQASAGPLAPGQRVGEFRLVKRIGRGGMGEVWEAVQESLERTVALKVMLPGRLDERALPFFGREARAGGKLMHPSIVAVYANGESDGVHWIAMEMVQGGVTLADFLDHMREQDGLPDDYYSGVAALLAKIADALEAAHTAGVIHRDHKPQNVLITPDDEPKVADFGLARVMSEHSLSQTGDFAGTYYYMSPEQVAARRIGIDHRTDVFSLGVLFYELLTLVRPFEGDTTQQIAHKILLDDPPDPQQIRSRVPRDLAVICGKAMEKKPGARYPTMAELAADLRRYLAHEPILAKPPTVTQRVAKWVRRNPTKSAVASVAAVALAVISVLLVANVRAGQALAASNEDLVNGREDLARANQELQQVVDFQSEQLSGIDVSAMGWDIRHRVLEGARAAGISARRDPSVLDAQARELEKLVAGTDFTGVALEALGEHLFEGALEAVEGFADQPLVQAQLLQAVATTMHDLGLLDRATKPQQQALEIRRRELGDEHPDTLESISNMGRLLEIQGKSAEAETLWREMVNVSRRTLGDEHTDTLTSINNLGVLLHAQGRLDEAEPLLREALGGLRRTLGDEHTATLVSIHSLGNLFRGQGELDQAERLLREALEVQRRRLGDQHTDTLVSISSLGNLRYAQGKVAEAESFCREALQAARRKFGDDHPNTLTSIHNLGFLLKEQGKVGDAEVLWREALEGRRRTIGEGHPDTRHSISKLGRLLQDRDKLDEAEPLLREVLELDRRTLGDDHADTITSIHNLGSLFRDQGRLEQAEPLWRELAERLRRGLGEDHADTITSIHNLGNLLLELHKSAEAEPYLREALEGHRRTLGDDHPDTLNVMYSLAMSLSDTKKFDEAEALARELLERTPKESPDYAAHVTALNSILAKKKAASSQRKE